MSAYAAAAAAGGGGGGGGGEGGGRGGEVPFRPTNNLVTPLLTDMYQLSMTYAHWVGGRVDDHAVFDLFFRKNPFHGQFTIFAGLDEVLRHLSAFRFTPDDIAYLKTILPSADEAFFTWLETLDCSKLKVYSMVEGSIVFPRQPLLRIEGPLAIGQLLETTLLNLINYPSLIATNAARMRLAAGPEKTLLEFGLRRAQGPDGGLSASKYAYLGGFDGTSNVLAGKITGIAIKGTHAHAYVMSHTGLGDLRSRMIKSAAGVEVDFQALCLEKRSLLGFDDTNESELAAFISYAQAFPNGVVALVDTYDTIQSGVPNFLAVGWALFELGYKPVGIRLDSGDLAYLSRATKAMYLETDAKIGKEIFAKCQIVASNDLNEDAILGLNVEGHEITTFGIGTHLVTCMKTPALGCVYKLVEIHGQPRIKLSQEIEKLVIPGRKNIYRLIGEGGHPLVDVMQGAHEAAPVAGVKMLCRDPFSEEKRAMVKPTVVQELLKLVWDGPNGGVVGEIVTLEQSRAYCKSQIASMRYDHIKTKAATPYKISVSADLYTFMHNLWMSSAPIKDLV